MSMKITKKYLQGEMVKFREIMGDKQYTVEKVSNALGGLLTVYANCTFVDKKEQKSAEISMLAITEEHNRRLALRLVHNI